MYFKTNPLYLETTFRDTRNDAAYCMK